MKCVVIVSVVAAMLAGLCAGMPADEPDIWFSTSVYPYGPPTRVRRAVGAERPLNATHVPSEVCGSMSPSMGHGTPARTEDPPYTVSVDRRSVAPGGIVTVKVSGTDSFKGIYIQGRTGEGNENDVPIGTFLPHTNPAVVISDCFDGTDNALSYVSRIALGEIELKWKAPDTPGKATFRCTVVKSFSVFWVGLKSQEIEIEID